MATALEQVIQSAEYPSKAEIRKKEKKLVEVTAKEERGKEAMKGLLGIERLSMKEMKKEVSALAKERKGLAAEVRYMGKYGKLSLRPLTWRNSQGWPRLAIFSLSSPRFSIAINGRTTRRWAVKQGFYDTALRTTRSFHSSVQPPMPTQIKDCYKDVIDKLRGMRKKNKGIRVSCEFTGVIPEDVKEKIREAKPLFKKLFIVAEAKQWKVNDTAIVRPRVDPMVVGWDGQDLWLVADFETTTVEESMIVHPTK